MEIFSIKFSETYHLQSYNHFIQRHLLEDCEEAHHMGESQNPGMYWGHVHFL